MYNQYRNISLEKIIILLELLTLPLIILNDDGLCYHLSYWQVRKRWWWPLQAINLKPFNHSILVLSSLHLFNWIKFHSCSMEKYYRWYNFVNVYLTRAFSIFRHFHNCFWFLNFSNERIIWHKTGTILLANQILLKIGYTFSGTYHVEGMQKNETMKS